MLVLMGLIRNYCLQCASAVQFVGTVQLYCYANIILGKDAFLLPGIEFFY